MWLGKDQDSLYLPNLTLPDAGILHNRIKHLETLPYAHLDPLLEYGNKSVSSMATYLHTRIFVSVIGKLK